MKVAFVVKDCGIESLGVEYLSGVARLGGHDTRIVDLMGVGVLPDWKPDVVGYSVMTGDQGAFLRVDDWLRMKGGGIRFAWGGPHATFFGLDFMGRGQVFRGDSEVEFGESLGVKVEDCWSVWPWRGDYNDGRRIRDFIGSRGCPYSCGYCYNEKWAEICGYEKRVEFRGAKDLCAEVKAVDPAFAYFQDSCFGVSLGWLQRFAVNYSGVPFHCHLRPNLVTLERVSLLKRAGCYSVRLALETAVPRLSEMLGRGDVDAEEVVKAVGLLKSAGIRVMVQNMVGLPTGSIEDDMATLEVNLRCAPDYAWVSIFQPYPGTRLGDLCKAEGWYKGDYSDISDSFFRTSALTFSDEYKEQMECLQRVFALAVETQTMPRVEELTHRSVGGFVHRAMRFVGDKRLYG